jgi:exopolysaccharide production protein ExoQ
MRSSRFRMPLVALGLVVLTNGPVFFINRRILDGALGWEEPFTRQVFVVTALVAVTAVVLDRYRESGEQLFRPSPVAAAAIVFFGVWIVLTTFWSLAPDITRGRSVIYLGLPALAWILADLDFPRFRAAVALAAGFGVGASLLVVGATERIGLDVNDDWKGIYTNRNSLAPVAATAIIIGSSLVADSRGGRRVAALALTVLSAVVMLGSGSRTAWLALAVAVGGAGVVVVARTAWDRHGARALAATGAVAAAGALFTVLLIARMWGEPTFSQRRTIWSLVWDEIGERPLQGFGWFSIWGVPEFTSGDPLLARGEAHNSLLEVWLGAGLIGVIPFLVIIAVALYGVTRAAWRNPGVESWTWLAVVLFLAIENLTESFVLWFSYNWVILMAAALRSGVGARRPSAARRPAATELVSG